MSIAKLTFYKSVMAALAPLLVLCCGAGSVLAEGIATKTEGMMWKCNTGYVFPYSTAAQACDPSGSYPLHSTYNTLCPNGKIATYSQTASLFVASAVPGMVVFGLSSSTTISGEGNCEGGGSSSSVPHLTATGNPTVSCPANSTLINGDCQCDRAYIAVTRDKITLCVPLQVRDLTKTAPVCEARGNPIYPASGCQAREY